MGRPASRPFDFFPSHLTILHLPCPFACPAPGRASQRQGARNGQTSFQFPIPVSFLLVFFLFHRLARYRPADQCPSFLAQLGHPTRVARKINGLDLGKISNPINVNSVVCPSPSFDKLERWMKSCQRWKMEAIGFDVDLGRRQFKSTPTSLRGRWGERTSGSPNTTPILDRFHSPAPDQ